MPPQPALYQQRYTTACLPSSANRNRVAQLDTHYATEHKCFIWENRGKATHWKEHLILTGKRCHEAKAADVERKRGQDSLIALVRPQSPGTHPQNCYHTLPMRAPPAIASPHLATPTRLSSHQRPFSWFIRLKNAPGSAREFS